MSKPVALITGASGGIGADFARVLAADGFDLILVARTEAAMKSLATELKSQHKCASTILPVDLAKPGAALEVARLVAERNLTVEVLVNNAGFGDTDALHEANADKLSQMVQLNCGTLTDLMRQFLPAMVERGHGRVLNIASTAAFQPLPRWAVYGASKAFVLSLSEAVAAEVAKFGVTVTAVCPGATWTNFAEAAAAKDTALFSTGKFAVMESLEVAKLGWEGAKRGQVVTVTGRLNTVQASAVRFLPRKLSTLIAKKLLGA